MTEQQALVLLNAIKITDARKLSALLDIFGSASELIKDENLKKVASVSEFGMKLSQVIVKAKKKFDPALEIDKCAKKGIRLISFFDEDYPILLREIHDPPVMLYVKGALPKNEAVIAIVGSRKASAYGLETAHQFAEDLAKKNIVVISGMALGIDTAAHYGALRGKGKTIAVLGCGVDYGYPVANRKLSENISQNGAVVSEYPLGWRPTSFSFPKRNRIIAGFSKGVVVVEAAQRSGSLITARLALEEGREVYSVPGRVDSKFASGTNNLIRQGAALAMNAAQVIEDLFPNNKTKINKKTQMEIIETLGLSDIEKSIYDAINSDSVAIDDLLCTLNFNRSSIFASLTKLEMKRAVKRLPGGTYARVGG